ncbi:MAG: acetyl-CoA carboxylase biotin carboxyl carrier protein [Syntrophomonadaceae bacterium]|jgi:oxaloacetate decarboxylase alpha subunit|nr:acetyl-CoA carboxylase biotin carboxyl carrier protein [Syntrophomonadaceae bacterium]
MNKIKITDTSLRDGHQSLWATRMSTEDMLPILESLDQVGYNSLEVWGGATFDVCLRFLEEDPWQRLKIIRQTVKQTRLQMLVRGQSLVGYAHYPDDIAEKFIDKAAENGIDIFRIFDALNDIRNLETCMKAVKKNGKHAQPCVVYTISPVHSLEHFLETAMRLQDMGADSICVKDMAGLLAPYASYELIKTLKDNLQVPVQLHTHYIGGLAIATLLKAAEAGVDVVDTASVPMAFGSSQPPVETVVRALQDSERDTGLNLHKLFEIANYFEDMRKKKGFSRGVTSINDMQVFEHQIPGGMLSNFISQLKEQNAVDRINEVLAEIPKVREDLGYPPLVTPTSQILGIQAVLNVLMGERYKLCPTELKDYVRGQYGRPPMPVKDEIRHKIIGDEEVIIVRPADFLEPLWEKAKEESAAWAKNDEDILTYALFPQVAAKFFEKRENNKLGENTESKIADEAADDKAVGQSKTSEPAKKAVSRGDDDMNVDDIKELITALDKSNINELEMQRKDYKLALRKGNSAVASGNAGNKTVGEEAEAGKADTETGAVDPDLYEIVSPMVGTFYAAPAPDADQFVHAGDRVRRGQTLCILEAMKLMNEIKADTEGVVSDILVKNAEAVEYGQVLFLIRKD